MKRNRPARGRAVRLGHEAASGYMPPVCFNAMLNVKRAVALANVSNIPIAASPSRSMNNDMKRTSSGDTLKPRAPRDARGSECAIGRPDSWAVGEDEPH